MKNKTTSLLTENELRLQEIRDFRKELELLNGAPLLNCSPKLLSEQQLLINDLCQDLSRWAKESKKGAGIKKFNSM